MPSSFPPRPIDDLELESRSARLLHQWQTLYFRAAARCRQWETWRRNRNTPEPADELEGEQTEAVA